MKNVHLFLLTILIASFISCSGNEKVLSPDGAVTAQIVQENDQLSLKVFLHGTDEMTVIYVNDYGKTMRLLVRAYNDGVAFRYAFDNDEIMQVVEENTTLVIPQTSNVWAMEYQLDDDDCWRYSRCDCGKYDVREPESTFRNNRKRKIIHV